jgi:hypothetical protein
MNLLTTDTNFDMMVSMMKPTKFKINTARRGSGGRVFDYTWENDTFSMEWNLDHPYVRKYLRTIDDGHCDKKGNPQQNRIIKPFLNLCPIPWPNRPICL